MVSGLGSIRLAKLLQYFSSAGKIFTAPVLELARVDCIGAVLAGRIHQAVSSRVFEEELWQIKNMAVRVITLIDKEYPALLKQIYDPPPVLYVYGNPAALGKTAVAVVGCRRASYCGLQQAGRLAQGLSSRGVCVVSGLARGIDTAAHSGALAGGSGGTVAVLGSGLLSMYPPENKALAKAIARNGAVVSEFCLHTAPLKGNFPRRNRIISGLSRAVVVVEAARRSGSLITADLALSQGREVYAVPGTANSLNAQGTNNLIKNGAKLVENVDDILEELVVPASGTEKMIGTSASEEEKGGPGGQLCRSEAGCRILELLSSEPLHIDVLITKSMLTPASVYQGILELQLQGLAQEIEGKKFVKKEAGHGT